MESLKTMCKNSLRPQKLGGPVCTPRCHVPGVHWQHTPWSHHASPPCMQLGGVGWLWEEAYIEQWEVGEEAGTAGMLVFYHSKWQSVYRGKAGFRYLNILISFDILRSLTKEQKRKWWLDKAENVGSEFASIWSVSFLSSVPIWATLIWKVWKMTSFLECC